MSSVDGHVGTLPPGAFHNIALGPFRLACLEREPAGSRGQCFRPRGHGGRHAFIAVSGRVWSVWGEDVHKAKRERGRLEAMLAYVLPDGGCGA